MSALLLSRPFEAADFATLREMQLDGAGLRDMATWTDRSVAEINVALDIKLGRTAEEAAEIVNARFGVAPAQPPQGKSTFSRLFREIFGREGRR